MGITDRIMEGVRLRLSYEQPYIQVWAQAMALGAHPANALTTYQKIHNIADYIWYISGDMSVDMSWYSKRLIVSGVFVSTELFMLTDGSEGFKDTEQFLH